MSALTADVGHSIQLSGNPSYLQVELRTIKGATSTFHDAKSQAPQVKRLRAHAIIMAWNHSVKSPEETAFAVFIAFGQSRSFG